MKKPNKKNLSYQIPCSVLPALLLFSICSFLFTPSVASAAVNTPTALEANKRIAAGAMHTTVLKANGEVLGWGRNSEGQCNIPAESQSGVIAVAAGYAHSLALKADGTVNAWGSTAHNRCAVPENLNNVIAIAAGNMHSLALRNDGTVVGWGNSNTAVLRDLPVGLNHVSAIASTNGHCLALKDDGTVIAWGENTDGQCNIPSDLDNIVAVATGYKHSLALKADGTVVAWGNNAYTQCDVPEGLNNVVAIAAGSQHSVALKDDHSVLVWGANNWDNIVTVPVQARNDVIGIAAGGDEFCLALKNNGELIAWGYNYYHPCDVPPELNMGGGLNSLAVNPGMLNPSFDSSTSNYSLELPCSVTAVELTAAVEDSAQQQLYIDDELQPNGEPKNITAEVGTTTVRISVNFPLGEAADTGSLIRLYNLGINRAGPDHTNANLWTITPDTGILSPAFDPAVTAYTITVPAETAALGLTAIPSDSTATVTVNEQSGTAGLPLTQQITLVPSENPVSITVQAGDGHTTKTYEVTIIRGPSGNAALTALSVNAGTLSPLFDPDTATYRVENPGTVTALAITAALADPAATLTISGETAEHNAAKTVLLAHGGNLIPIVVTSPNELYQKAYVLSVNGTVNDAQLANLTVQSINNGDPENPQELHLNFDPTVTNYSFAVPHNIDQLQITATPSDSKALLLQEDTLLSPGEARSIALADGLNTVKIIVVAQDASTNTYTLAITRGAALDLVTTTLPLGLLNIPYSATLAAQGGTIPYSWSVSGLPAGLVLEESTGTISGTPSAEGSFPLTITVTDQPGFTQQQELTLSIQQGCGNGGYLLTPVANPAYTTGYTAAGLPIMTVQNGTSGFTEFSIAITPVKGHEGTEKAVFVQQRNNLQLNIATVGTDFELARSASAAFNVEPQDIIKVYLVDDLTNSVMANPDIL